MEPRCRAERPRGRRALLLRALVPVVLGAGLTQGPGALEAQSFLSSGGLGLPGFPMDGRSLALGGVGIGLMGGELGATDPVAAGGLLLPTVVFSMQPARSTYQLGDEAGEARTHRFPIMGASYPVRSRGMLTFTLGTFLDQRWRSVVEQDLDLGSGPVPVSDVFESDGGVSRVQFGYVHNLGGGVATGLSVGAHAGEWSRSFTRHIDPFAEAPEVDDFQDSGRWRVTGPTGTVGMSWTPGPMLRIAGSVTWSGDLTATPDRQTAGDTVAYSLPWELRLGASGALTPDLSVNVGFHRADWTGTGISSGALVGAATDAGVPGAATTIGGGLEFTGSQFMGRGFPIRLGYRASTLPFPFQGEAPSERAFAGGVGWLLSSVESIPLARFDLSVERGSREAGTLSERFWRTTLSLRVSGG